MGTARFVSYSPCVEGRLCFIPFLLNRAVLSELDSIKLDQNKARVRFIIKAQKKAPPALRWDLERISAAGAFRAFLGERIMLVVYGAGLGTYVLIAGCGLVLPLPSPRWFLAEEEAVIVQTAIHAPGNLGCSQAKRRPPTLD